jgi:streptomycin 6-kinase
MSARYGFVVAVSTPIGPLIMRSSPDPDGGNQAAVSLALADLGVSPKVHDFVETDTGTWTVADRVLPGTPIGELPSRGNPALIAAMLRPMVEQPAPALNMPSLIDWLRDRLTDPQLTDLPIGRQPAPSEERQQALEQLKSLTAEGTVGLCHGDPSPRNILLGADDRPWLVDPRGMAGEVDYDIAVIALKAARYVSPKLAVAHLASYVGVDPARASAWLLIANAARV